MKINSSDVSILQSKMHFQVLDGLRGLAALVVVVFHFMEIAITDYNTNFIAHGYLAVDFFFCLSGFVISYAYDHRVVALGLKSFIKLRLIRLYPLVIIGSVLGLITFLIDPYSDYFTQYGFVKTCIIFITSILVIPYPIMPERYLNLFSLNAPTWSLFWEFVANLIYATFLYKIAKKGLLLVTCIAAISLCYVSYYRGNISGGWGGPSFVDGFFRIAFSFLMGMLMYRSNWIIKNKLGLPGMTALILIAFLFPYNDHWNWFAEPFIVIVYLPLLVSLGAGTSLAHHHQKINSFSGDISYPLYMVHYPFVWIFLTYVSTQKPPLSQLMYIIPISILLILILAYVISRFVDQPVRRHLTQRFIK